MHAPLYFIRHAQSQANADPTVLKQKTNIGICLTHTGVTQAAQAALAMEEEVVNFSDDEILKVWNSPYDRTRETANILKQHLRTCGIDFLEEESIYLSERQFGIVDDAPDYRLTHSAEYSHYMLHKQAKQDFFARPPLGESPFDVCLRIDFFLKTILGAQSIDPKSGKRIRHALVFHGAAIRAAVVMRLSKNYEFYNEILNPVNASITKITADGELFYEWFKPSIITK